MTAQPFHGVLVPVLTPFTPAGEPDAGRFTAFCRFLLDQGAGGLSIFGTTSEANSMSPAERMALLDHLVAAGIPAEKLMPGTGACAMTDAATLVRHAVGHGCGGVLMLPPFYYKPVSDDGIFAFVSGVIDKVGSSALRVYLYHIPPVAVVGYSLDLVGRLIKAYPQTVVGLKDSSGDWSNTAALLDRYPGFRGIPRLRGVSARRAAQGRGRLHHRDRQHQRAGDRASSTPIGRGRRPTRLQAEATTVRKTMQAYPMVPALKRVVAHFHDDPDWAAVRPPLTRARPRAIGGADRRPRQDRLQPRRAPAAGRRRVKPQV